MPEQETDGGRETHGEKSDRLVALVSAAPGRQTGGLCGMLDPASLDYLTNSRTVRGSLTKKQIVLEQAPEFVF